MTTKGVNPEICGGNNFFLAFVFSFLRGLKANIMFARLGTDYEIRNQWFFAILEAMTSD